MVHLAFLHFGADVQATEFKDNGHVAMFFVLFWEETTLGYCIKDRFQ